jgi:aspartate/methionine/tyrosine aminotransferase
METRTFDLSQRVDNSGVVMWEEFKELTAKYNCISLGEGAPSTMPPQFLIDDLTTAIKEGHNQYSRAFGHPLLA